MINRRLTIIGWFFSLLITLPLIYYLHLSDGSMYYAVLILGAVTMFFLSVKTVDIPMILLIIVCALSIIANPDTAVFMPWQRLLLFIIVILFVGPLLVSYKNAIIKTQVLFGFSYLFVLITIISTIMYFMGLGFFDFKDGTPNSYFQGLTVQSMVMGPVASISCLFSMCLMIGKNKFREKLFYIIVILGGLLCVLQAGSRSAFLGSIVSLLVFLLYAKKNRSDKSVRRIIVIIFVLLISSPLWLPYTDKLMEKNSSASMIDVSSREGLWKLRIEEFKSSPLLGVGFQSVSIGHDYSYIRAENGGVETGTSWLAVLSMTGILGFLAFSFLYIRAIRGLWKIKKTYPIIGSYLLSLVVFFGIHMFGEGYVFAGGNPLCLFYWLIIGVVNGLDYYPSLLKGLEYTITYGPFSKSRILS